MESAASFFARLYKIEKPWVVTDVELRDDGSVELRVEPAPGAMFPCPGCGTLCTVYDSYWRTWELLPLGQHKCTINARVPRVACSGCGKDGKRRVLLVSTPWGGQNVHYSYEFRDYVLRQAALRPVQTIAGDLGVSDVTLWDLLKKHVLPAVEAQDLSGMKRLCLDETSSATGHDYITQFVDPDYVGPDGLKHPRVVFATPGKDAGTVEAFVDFLVRHGGRPENIEEICCDMSKAFLSGCLKLFPRAELVIDRFHMTKLVGDALDAVRRQEARTRPELRGSRYAWLKNTENLTESQKAKRDELTRPGLRLRTARAWKLREDFQKIYDMPAEQAEGALQKWFWRASHSRLEPMVKAAWSVKSHWAGIMNWFRNRTSNGIMEGMNSMVQSVKARARGYRSKQNFILMAYLVGGRLDFSAPRQADGAGLA